MGTKQIDGMCCTHPLLTRNNYGHKHCSKTNRLDYSRDAAALLSVAQAYADSPEPQVPPSQEELDAMAPSQEEQDALKDRVDAQPIYAYNKTEDSPMNADIAPRSPWGTYPTYKGTILVTADKFSGIIPTGHAGIIFRYDTVIESLAEGVTWGPNDWNSSKNTAYGATVKGTTSLQDQNVANWCYNQMGKPYNYNFLDTMNRNSFYCSQLVWAGFYDNYGIDISTGLMGSIIHPMEILESENAMTIYRKS